MRAKRRLRRDTCLSDMFGVQTGGCVSVDGNGKVSIAGPGIPWTGVSGTGGRPGEPVRVPCQDRSCMGHRGPPPSSGSRK